MDHFLDSLKFTQKWSKNGLPGGRSHGPQNGLKMDPKMEPKWIQNGPKKSSKRHQNLFENYSKCNLNFIKVISESIKIQSIMNPFDRVCILVPAN